VGAGAAPDEAGGLILEQLAWEPGPVYTRGQIIDRQTAYGRGYRMAEW